MAAVGFEPTTKGLLIIEGISNMNTIEAVLSYIGAILIAMEFVRKFTKLQALMGMLVGWPVAQIFGDKRLADWYVIYKKHRLKFVMRIIFSFILCIITLPLTVGFYIIWFVILILNSIHNWVNRLYFEGIQRYRPFYSMLIGLSLFAHTMSDYKKYAKSSEY